MEHGGPNAIAGSDVVEIRWTGERALAQHVPPNCISDHGGVH